MFRVLLVLLVATSALAMDAAYSPHRVLISTGTGFATHATLLGSEPRPHHSAYPDLTGSIDRVDKFAFNLYWKENPPLTPTEASRLSALESNITSTTVPSADLVFLQAKAQKWIKQPVELDMQIQIILATPEGDYASTWVSLEKYELLADAAVANAPEPPYFPGLAINHDPIFITVTQDNVIQLPRSWRSKWQPVLLRGSYRGPAGNTGDITLKFRRHQSILMALGTLTNRDGKFSVMSNATYNRESNCSLAPLVNQPWVNYLNGDWTNWAGGNAVDFSQFKLQFANYGAAKFDPVLPEYNRDGDPFPCPPQLACTKAHVEDHPCPEPPPCPTCTRAHVDDHPCPPCTKAHVEDHPCPPPTACPPCTKPHVEDNPCTLAHLKDHTCPVPPPCPACTKPHVEDHPCPEPPPCPLAHLKDHTCPVCQLAHVKDNPCPPCPLQHVPTPVPTPTVKPVPVPTVKPTPVPTVKPRCTRNHVHGGKDCDDRDDDDKKDDKRK